MLWELKFPLEFPRSHEISNGARQVFQQCTDTSFSFFFSFIPSLLPSLLPPTFHPSIYIHIDIGIVHTYLLYL